MSITDHAIAAEAARVHARDAHLRVAAAAKHAKPRMSLLPWSALVAVAHVMTAGASKYAANSWQEPPFSADDYMCAMLRHVSRMGIGERRDKDSGQLHAAHVACNALFLLWYVLRDEPVGTEV
jgi:hypothetical protein